MTHLKAWLWRWIAFRPAPRETVLEAMRQITPAPTRTAPSWRVMPRRSWQAMADRILRRSA